MTDSIRAALLIAIDPVDLRESFRPFLRTGHSVGEAPKVTGQAYIERNAAVAAQGERALRVLQGGRR